MAKSATENLLEVVRLRAEYAAEKDGLGYSPEALRSAKARYHHEFSPERVLALVDALRAFAHRSADLRPLLRHEMSTAILLLEEIDRKAAHG